MQPKIGYAKVGLKGNHGSSGAAPTFLIGRHMDSDVYKTENASQSFQTDSPRSLRKYRLRQSIMSSPRRTRARITAKTSTADLLQTTTRELQLVRSEKESLQLKYE